MRPLTMEALETMSQRAEYVLTSAVIPATALPVIVRNLAADVTRLVKDGILARQAFVETAAFRCDQHATVGPMNGAANGRECGACIAEARYLPPKEGLQS